MGQARLPIQYPFEDRRGRLFGRNRTNVTCARVEVSEWLVIALVKSTAPHKAEEYLLRCILGILFGGKTPCAIAEYLVVMIFRELFRQNRCICFDVDLVSAAAIFVILLSFAL